MKLTSVMGHECGVLSQRVTGDPQVIGTDGGARVLEAGELFGVVLTDARPCRVEDANLMLQDIQAALDQLLADES